MCNLPRRDLDLAEIMLESREACLPAFILGLPVLPACSKTQELRTPLSLSEQLPLIRASPWLFAQHEHSLALTRIHTVDKGLCSSEHMACRPCLTMATAEPHLTFQLVPQEARQH